MLTTTHWQTIRDLVAWIDGSNGRDPHEIAMRILKVTEEAGEVSAAYIGMTGQNPRKGVTHTLVDVQGELCDVMLTAAVALASLSDDPAAVFDAKIRKVAERAAAVQVAQ
ncbi:MazG-like family protein [Streptomyces sp. NPDC056652]|uniref:MazG-like family protein n=1 Tax=Streptomyces sp. NPDC056652 TaxID=3345893 RepID=UPI0036C3A860